MHKIKQVILKDLKNRLSKRWFWILSLMGPMIFTLMIIVPVGLNMKTAGNKVVEVWQDPMGSLPIEELPKNEQFNYMIAHGDLDRCLAEFLKSKHDVFIVIPTNITNEEVLIYEKKKLSVHIKKLINLDLVNVLKLKHLHIIYGKEEIGRLEHAFTYKSIPLNSDGKGAAQMVVGLVSAIVIYYFTFSYSIQ
ncbi:MAG TPA: hypothetical protein VL947_04900, partial [Cytophagales bacterium]|nr:hypothetical protein [Cytophagales bacterium]